MGEVAICQNPHCQCTYEKSPSAPHQKWCGNSCARCARNERRRCNEPTRYIPCVVCGRLFPQSRFHPGRQDCCGSGECLRLRRRQCYASSRQSRREHDRQNNPAEAFGPTDDVTTDGGSEALGQRPSEPDGEPSGPVPSARRAQPSTSALAPPATVATANRTRGERRCANPSCCNRFEVLPSRPEKRYCCESCRQAHRTAQRRSKDVPAPVVCEMCGESFTPDLRHRYSQKCCPRLQCRRLRNKQQQCAWRRLLRNLLASSRQPGCMAVTVSGDLRCSVPVLALEPNVPP